MQITEAQASFAKKTLAFLRLHLIPCCPLQRGGSKGQAATTWEVSMNSSAIVNGAHLGFRKIERAGSANAPTKLMSPEEVASLLRVSKGMVSKLVRTGKLDAVHVGRLVRIPPESYDALIASRGA